MRMDPVNKICKFFHTLSDIDSQIRIYIIIVCNGIWRACNALDCVFVYRWYSVTGIVSAGGMRYYACKPDMCCAHFSDSFQNAVSEIVELAAAVLVDRPVGYGIVLTVAKQPCKYLIDD